MLSDCVFLLCDESRTDDEEEVQDPTIKLFDKEKLCEIIISGDGIVLDSYEDAKKCGRNKMFLVADTYSRTKEYIQCVASNVPCVQYHWLLYSCLTKRFINYFSYILPTGFSLIQQKEMRWHGKGDIFKDLKIVVTSEKKAEFIDIWVSVLQAAKADLIQTYELLSFDILDETFDVNLIVTDETCEREILEAAKREKVPVVSSEWIIQSVIAGEKLPYDAHPKFQHDFRE